MKASFRGVSPAFAWLGWCPPEALRVVESQVSLEVDREEGSGKTQNWLPHSRCRQLDICKSDGVCPVIEGVPSTQLGRHHSFLVGTIHSHGYPGGRALECLAIQGFLVVSSKSNVIWLAAPAEVDSASNRKVLVHSTEREEEGSFRKILKWSKRIEGLFLCGAPLSFTVTGWASDSV